MKVPSCAFCISSTRKCPPGLSSMGVGSNWLFVPVCISTHQDVRSVAGGSSYPDGSAGTVGQASAISSARYGGADRRFEIPPEDVKGKRALRAATWRGVALRLIARNFLPSPSISLRGLKAELLALPLIAEHKAALLAARPQLEPDWVSQSPPGLHGAERWPL